MERPLVSIVTIFLNEERYLGEAIASVAGQTYQRWELLLVDDGSTDGSTAIAREWAARDPARVRWLEHPGHANRGKSSSRNLGIEQARGSYVTFLDADDEFLPDKLERQVAILERHREAAMVYGRTLYWFGGGDGSQDFVSKLGVEPDRLFPPPSLLTLFLRDGGSIPCICSLLARRELVQALGGFEERIQHLYEDQVLLAKLCLAAPVYVESGCRERYRQHAASSSARAIAAGADHPLAPSPARAAFLSWLTDYLAAHPVADAALAHALERAWWSIHHPTLDALLRAAQAQGRVVRRYWRAFRTRLRPSATRTA
jgi:GT2 family glycosyltransferase